MSEAEEFSRMSELAEVSDEDDYESTYDDIPEEPSDLEMTHDEDNEAWPEVEFERNCQADEATSVEQTVTKAKSKPYVTVVSFYTIIR